jgi:hypothetical protein
MRRSARAGTRCHALFDLGGRHAAIRARGDEIVGPGRTNSERQSVLDQQPAGFGAAAYVWC